MSAVAAAAIALYVTGHPFIAQDAAFEREVKAANWGPLPLSFPVFSFIGDAKGAALEAILFVAILIFNRRAWLLAAGLSLSAGWYVLISHLVIRARPTTAQVLRVTEHPGASSFPSGHTMFIVTIVAVLMLCFGRRYLPPWGQAIGWIVGVMLVLANGISRMYVGVHWPTDVLAAILIAVAWICFCVSLRRVSDRAFSSQPAQARGRDGAGR
ncbi:MAG TPA: phosphatase PAP2 family protein [Candidatus Sulfotelmatobacter sp.]|nr:phosphatase PAP2 family protein [Candidatus Sulfotelmatobacter sp.]